MGDETPSGFLAQLDAEETQEASAPVAAVVVSRTRDLRSTEDRAMDRIKKIEDKILEKTMRIVDLGMGGADGDDGQDEIPDEWIKEHGIRGASRAMRVAQDARKSPKEHPVYLDLAKSVMVGILKARAGQIGDAPALNVNVQIVMPQKTYDVIDVEPEK